MRSHPPTPANGLQRSTFFADRRFSRFELGTILKDHNDQHCWSKPIEQCGYLALLLFFFFLNSDIFRTAKYTHKLVLGPKKSILKFNPYTADGFPIEE